MGSIFYRRKEGKRDKQGRERGAWVYEDKKAGVFDTLNEAYTREFQRLREGGIKKPFAEVVDFLLTHKDEVESGEVYIRNSTPLVRDYAETYLDYKTSIGLRSIVSSRRAMKYFLAMFGNRHMDEVKIEDIDDFKIQRRKSGIKTNSLLRELAIVKAFFNHAIQRDVFKGKNPIKIGKEDREDDRRERILTYAEEEGLLEVSTQPTRDLIKLSLSSGMRLNEMLSCKWEWVDFKNNVIQLPSSIAKAKVRQRVLLNQDAFSLLRERKLRTANSEYVFPSDRIAGEHLSRRPDGWMEAVKKAGLKGLRLHDLRHTFATRVGEAGYPVQVIAELIRVSSIDIAMRYVHPGASVKEAVESITKRETESRIKRHD